MESNIHASAEGVRYSNSPRRYTQVMQGLQSPARSVHPEHGGMGTGQMESIDSQADFGLRTTDFLDFESEDDEPLPGSAVTAPDVDPILERSGSPSKKKRPISSTQTMVSQCEPKGVSIRPDEPRSEGYERLDSNLNQHVPDRATASPETSFNGSVEEMDFQPNDSSTPQQPKKLRLSSTQRYRTSGLWGPQQPVRYGENQGGLQDSRMSMYSDKVEQRLGLHAAAYDLALNGILKDPELARLDPLNDPRLSQLPPRLSINSKKKVDIVKPPPLASADKGSFPDDPQRTPYPFDKESPHPKPSPMPRERDAILILSIRRGYHNNSVKSTSVTIPAEKATLGRDYSVPGADERSAINSFDDEDFFNALRSAYISLAGPYRFFSARTLLRIALKGPATKAADARYGWIPSSPRLQPAKSSRDTSVEKAYKYYKRPSLGKDRVPYVNWARELAGAVPYVKVVPSDEMDSETAPEGLEFVLGWSVPRILLAMFLVVLLAIAATLLWIFLGKNTPASWPAPAHAGFRDAGDRVGTGILIGVLVLLVGMTGVSGWLGVSWLVM